MSSAVVVFAFPEPGENGYLAFPVIVERAKKVFEGMEDVKIHAAVRNAADTILYFLETGEDPTSNLVEHAKRELALAGNDEDFNNSLINAVKAFATYGHSGGSASVAIPMLNDLLQFKNLTPLTDDPKEWNLVGPGVWQSQRCSEAFSEDEGKTYYLLSEEDKENNQQVRHNSKKRE